MGGSDDDLVFGTTKDVNGNAVSQNFFSTKVNFASSVTQDSNCMRARIAARLNALRSAYWSCLIPKEV